MSQRGAAVVEFVLVMPILLVLLFSGLSLSQFALAHQALEGSTAAVTRSCVMLAPAIAATSGDQNELTTCVTSNFGSYQPTSRLLQCPNPSVDARVLPPDAEDPYDPFVQSSRVQLLRTTVSCTLSPMFGVKGLTDIELVAENAMPFFWRDWGS